MNDQHSLSHYLWLGGDKDGGGKSSSNDEDEGEDENHDEDDNGSESGGLGGTAACGDVVTVRRLLADGGDVEQRFGKVSAACSWEAVVRKDLPQTIRARGPRGADGT